MEDIDIDPFGGAECPATAKQGEASREHESRPDENIPLTPVGGGSTWEPEQEQEASFGGGESQRTKLMKDHVKDLYKKLSENVCETPEAFHFDYFKLEDGELYYRDKRKPLTYGEGKLKSAKEIKKILGKRGLRNLGFFEEKVIAEQATMLNIELQEIAKSTKT